MVSITEEASIFQSYKFRSPPVLDKVMIFLYKDQAKWLTYAQGLPLINKGLGEMHVASVLSCLLGCYCNGASLVVQIVLLYILK